MSVFRFTDDRASNCYQETVRKAIILLFLIPSNVKVLENLKTIVSLLKELPNYYEVQSKMRGIVLTISFICNFSIIWHLGRKALTLIS